MDIKIDLTGEKLVFGLFIIASLLSVVVDGMQDFADGKYFWAAFNASFVAAFAHAYWTNWRHKVV